MSAAVIVSSEKAAREGVPGARPESSFSRIEVAIILVETAGEDKGNRPLDGVLPQDVREAFSVAPKSLLPFFWFVAPLIDARGSGCFEVAQRVHHRLPVDLCPLALRQGRKLVRTLHASHVQIIENVFNAFPGRFWGGWRRGGDLDLTLSEACPQNTEWVK